MPDDKTVVNPYRKYNYRITIAEGGIIGHFTRCEGIEAGQLVIVVGLAVVKPAEFVIFRIGHFAGGAEKFKPAQQQSTPADAAAPAVPQRIAAPRGHDNGWWWEGIDRGEILIQKCSECGTLRHPPRPMCHVCRSLAWETQPSRGTGSVHSHVVMHHPPVPGYDFPVAVGLIDLDEGTRIVANIVDCPFEDIHIGMKVEGSIEELGGLRVPVFRKLG
jgi:uncharacterized OB-fold protein